MVAKTVIKNPALFLSFIFTLTVSLCYSQSKKVSYILYESNDQNKGLLDTGEYSEKLLQDDQVVFIIGDMSLGVTDKFIVSKKKYGMKASYPTTNNCFELLNIKQLKSVYKSEIDSLLKKSSSYDGFKKVGIVNIVEQNYPDSLIVSEAVWKTYTGILE